MKENLEFIGRSYDPEEKDALKEVLKEWSKESSAPVDGELEKTEEEIKIIDTINDFISEELIHLGIDSYETMPVGKIHILPGDSFKVHFPDFEGQAFFKATNDSIYLNKDGLDTKAKLFSTLLHELIHRASTKKFYTDEEKNISDARVGYRIHSTWKGVERRNRLVGFNEVIVDYTVYKILSKNQKILEEKIGVTEEDIQGSIYTYMHYGPILEAIIVKIAQDKGLDFRNVFEDLERGQFQNNILVLKDVERSFGKGSLKVLSLLQSLEKREDNNKLENMIKEFFSESDEGRRQELIKEIEEFVGEIYKNSRPDKD